MKNKLVASVILVIFGAGLLFIAYQFAPLAYAAPSTNIPHSTAPTILEFAYGVPAVVFTVAGVAAIIGGVALAALALIGAHAP